MRIVIYLFVGLLWTIWAAKIQLKYHPYAPICTKMQVFLLNFLFWPWFLLCAATRTPDEFAKFCDGKFLTRDQIYNVESGISIAKYMINEHSAVEHTKHEVYHAYKAMDMEIKEDDWWLMERVKLDKQWEEEHKNNPSPYYGGD